MAGVFGERSEIVELAARVASIEELIIETRDRLAWMEAEYRRVLAGRLARLEELEAQRVRLTTGPDEAAEERAAQARKIAGEPTFQERHRSLVKRIHPDRALSEEDRLRREDLMRRLNDSWSRRDMDAFSMVEAEVDLLTIDEITDEQERITILGRIRARFLTRLEALNQDLETLKSSAVWSLLELVDTAAQEGRDYLAEQAAELDAAISELERQVGVLRKGEVA